VLAGTLAWTGNFRLAFEVDNQQSLRVSAGINPYASEYTLPANQPFVTPEFIFTYSTTGKGPASRNLHRWARRYGVLDGTQPRVTLLNNWESTFFNFNEPKLDSIMGDAARRRRVFARRWLVWQQIPPQRRHAGPRRLAAHQNQATQRRGPFGANGC